MTSQLHDVDWVCERFGGQSRDAIYSWVRNGLLPGVVRVGQRIFFDPEAIEAFIERGGRPPRDADDADQDLPADHDRP